MTAANTDIEEKNISSDDVKVESAEEYRRSNASGKRSSYIILY